MLHWAGAVVLAALILGTIAAAVAHPQDASGPFGSAGMTVALALLAAVAFGAALFTRMAQGRPERHAHGDGCHKCGRRPNLTTAFCFFCGERYREA